VGTITIKFVGTANVSEQVVRANMQVREGTGWTRRMIDRDIRSLYRTGLFEFIEVKRERPPARGQLGGRGHAQVSRPGGPVRGQ
jgi:outer membrane protein insertion porin family